TSRGPRPVPCPTRGGWARRPSRGSRRTTRCSSRAPTRPNRLVHVRALRLRELAHLEVRHPDSDPERVLTRGRQNHSSAHLPILRRHRSTDKKDSNTLDNGVQEKSQKSFSGGNSAP